MVAGRQAGLVLIGRESKKLIIKGRERRIMTNLGSKRKVEYFIYLVKKIDSLKFDGKNKEQLRVLKVKRKTGINRGKNAWVGRVGKDRGEECGKQDLSWGTEEKGRKTEEIKVTTLGKTMMRR